MCGIAGYYRLAQDADLPFDWTRMVEVQRHRGPDEEGYFQDRRAGLGMRRLSIIDLAGGQQPQSNERGSVHVIQNGEIYNYRALRVELERAGHRFETESDTETLAHGYEEWGAELPRHLRAMFAFAVWDSEAERLLLARDHFGVKPLFYMVVGGVLWFASEIKGLLEHPGLKRTVDVRALDQYLSFLYVPAPRTLFREIRELPPAHRLVAEHGKVRVERYWAPERAAERRPVRTAEEVAAAFEDSVRAQMVSDVPLGAFLSGGLDSAAIVAMMKRHTAERVKTFSLGFGRAEQNWDESATAAEVARRFGTEHHAFHVEPDIVTLAPQVVAQFDQPFANPTAVLMLLLARETRREVKVALAGTGGDELLAGYPRYLGMLARAPYARVPEPARRALAGAGRALLRDRSDGDLRAQRARRFLEGGALAFDECYLRWLTAVNDEDKRALYTPMLQRELGDADTYDFIRPYLQDAGVPPEERLMLADFQTYLPFNQLAYADRMSMAASLEVRVPFVDQVLFEAVAGIPLRAKLKGRRTKGLFREAMAPYLPPFLLDAPKRGLNLPIALWFRGPLKGWLDEVLARDKIEARGWLNPDAVQAVRDEHTAGRRDHSLFLWALVMLELWEERIGVPVPGAVAFMERQAG